MIIRPKTVVSICLSIIALMLLTGVFAAQQAKIMELQADKDELIELNHDKSLYIDSVEQDGYHLPYRGTEETRP